MQLKPSETIWLPKGADPQRFSLVLLPPGQQPPRDLEAYLSLAGRMLARLVSEADEDALQQAEEVINFSPDLAENFARSLTDPRFPQELLEYQTGQGEEPLDLWRQGIAELLPAKPDQEQADVAKAWIAQLDLVAYLEQILVG